MARICFIYTTWPNRRAAEKTANQLLKDELVACANILDGMVSQYIWQGQKQKSRECVMILKTRDQLYKAVERRVLELHSYECPCIVKLAVQNAHKNFEKWVFAETNLSRKPLVSKNKRPKARL